MKNKSGNIRRTTKDNHVKYAPGPVTFKGNVIDFNKTHQQWLLNGKIAPDKGSLSDLSKALGLNVETHDIGKYLESNGYIFNTPFVESQLLSDLGAIQKDPSLTDTEKAVLAKARIGQGIFRQQLIDYWQACAVTACTLRPLLRASHIKPWKDCTSNAERLDCYNGLLLLPNLDILFDKGLISFQDDGSIIISDSLKENDARILGIHKELKLSKVESSHLKYLHYHRDNVFS